MNNYLNRAGAPPATADDVAMDWMGHPVRPADMPGMPTEAESAALDAAEGLAADDEFTHLMIRHHAAGSAMAAYAAEHGEHPGVRTFAAADGPRATQRDQRDQPPAGRARPSRGVARGDPRGRAPPHRLTACETVSTGEEWSVHSVDVRREFGPERGAAADARAFAVGALPPSSDVAERVALLVSELAANAHPACTFAVLGPDARGAVAGPHRGDRPRSGCAGTPKLRQGRDHRAGIGNCRKHVRPLGFRPTRGEHDRVVRGGSVNERTEEFRIELLQLPRAPLRTLDGARRGRAARVRRRARRRRARGQRPGPPRGHGAGVRHAVRGVPVDDGRCSMHSWRVATTTKTS